MKASELIKLLQEQIEKNGDRDVCLDCEEGLKEDFKVAFEDYDGFYDVNEEDKYIKLG